MKVKTYYVPAKSLGYLTPGKEYEVFDGDEVAGHIIDDVGEDIFIYVPSSDHLNNHPWQIVEENDMNAVEFKVGDICKIIDNMGEHGFTIGSLVVIKEIDKDGDYAAWSLDDSDYWWVCDEELEAHSPITSECDTLREEIAILEAETRKLHNEINELRKVPVYPEKAVRAVWEHGYSTFIAARYEEYAEEVCDIFTDALQKGE